MKAKPIPRISDIVGALLKQAPLDWAESWDNVGFLAGDCDQQVTGIVVAVNLGPEALEKAKATAANLIVCHHPPIFKPLTKLTKASHPYLYEAVRSGIGVLTLHTNFDLASQTVNHDLCNKLGLTFKDFLARRGGEEPTSLTVGKFITYVPETHLEPLRIALSQAGAGHIGDYSECSFSWPGQGTFKGGITSNPSIGKAGQLEKAQEYRLEMVFPWKSLEKIVTTARSAHPYEEMAYDVVKLGQPAQHIGFGFIGDSASNLSFPQLLQNVKDIFKLDSVTVVTPNFDTSLNQPLKRVAFSPGSGSAFVNSAITKGADIYICGEVGYHNMLDARRGGMSLILLGHSYSERFFIETVSRWGESLFPGSVYKVFETIHQNM